MQREFQNEQDHKVKTKIQTILKSRNIELAHEKIAIPGKIASGLFNGFLWKTRLVHSKEYSPYIQKSKGDWIGAGDVVMSLAGAKIINPINGILISNPTDYDPLWEIVPQKGYQISENVGELVFGEFIELLYHKIKNKKDWNGRFQPDKIPLIIEELELAILRLKSTRLVTNELDDRSKSLFEGE